MESGKLVSKKGKREGHMWERERKRVVPIFYPDLTRKPATLTLLQPPIPATSPAELGTDLKLEWCRSYFHCHRRQKTARTPTIEARKDAAKTHHHRRLFRRSLGTPPTGSTPHVTSIIFRPTSSPERAGLLLIGYLRTHGLGSSIYRRHRTLEPTATTVELTEV